jgi:hypothetical protein
MIRLRTIPSARGRSHLLVDAYASGVLSLEEIADQKAGLDRQIDGLTKTIDSLRAEIQDLASSGCIEKVVDRIMGKPFSEILEISRNKEAQLKIFEEFGVKVTLYGEGRRHWCEISCVFGGKIDKPTFNKPDVLLHCKSEI